MIVNLKHSSSGVIKQAKIGFSWTTLLFSWLVPLFRGDAKWTIIMLLVILVTFGIAWIVFPFIYNKIYIKSLLEKGYTPSDEQSRQLLVSAGIISA